MQDRITFQFRLDKAERALLDRIACEVRITPSEFLRRVIWQAGASLNLVPPRPALQFDISQAALTPERELVNSDRAA